METNSILETIKDMLPISRDDINFDSQLLVHINTTIMELEQLGIGPSEGLHVSDFTTEWSELIGTSKNLEAIKSYMYMVVKLAFDPPSTSFGIEALTKSIARLEWRLAEQVKALNISQ